MSEVPPSSNESVPPPPMAVQPPPPMEPVAQYPRQRGAVLAQQFMGSPDHLEALADGYFGLNRVFLFNILWALICMGVLIWLSGANNDLFAIFFLLFALLTIPVVAFISYKPVKRLAFGMRWSDKSVVWVALLMGVGVLFAGILVYIALQTMAASEIGKYRVKRSFFGGFRKKDIKACVDAMRASPPYQAQQSAV